MINALAFFEEIRFVWELLGAEFLFAALVGRKRAPFGARCICCGAALSFVACIYPFFSGQFQGGEGTFWVYAANIGWYALLTVGSYFCTRLCYSLSVTDTLLVCVAGYSLQHIEYVAVNEVVALGIWPHLRDMLPLYVCACAGTAALLYGGVYRICIRKFAGFNGTLFEDRRGNIVFGALMCASLFMATFMCQSIFVSGRQDYDEINYLGAAADFFICFLVLGVLYALCRIRLLSQEKEIVEQLLYERKRQYALSRENIDAINRKCHDMKHQLRALEQVDAGERSRYLEELEKSISIYDSVVETGNEVVDTILSEKCLNCERRQIKLSCMVDAGYLDFMSTLDIYALLGNALDNAIEGVSRYQDADKRVISLSIEAKGDFLSIQTNNYCEGEIRMRDGLPVTTKGNRAYHGFGMKSMRHLAKKYGGSMVADVRDNMFTLQILLPMPREFLRLYSQERGRK